MASELKTSKTGSALPVRVGERVTLRDSEAEYVVVSVDHATGRLELLRLKPGRIESGVLVSNIERASQQGSLTMEVSAD